jgi:hypothetical protein
MLRIPDLSPSDAQDAKSRGLTSGDSGGQSALPSLPYVLFGPELPTAKRATVNSDVMQDEKEAARTVPTCVTNKNSGVGFEVPTAVVMKASVSWHGTPCSLRWKATDTDIQAA